MLRARDKSCIVIVRHKDLDRRPGGSIFLFIDTIGNLLKIGNLMLISLGIIRFQELPPSSEVPAFAAFNVYRVDRGGTFRAANHVHSMFAEKI